MANLSDVEWSSTVVIGKPFPEDLFYVMRLIRTPNKDRVVSIRPGSGSNWLCLDLTLDIVQALNDFTEGNEPDETYEIRFGDAPVGWTSTLPEHDGW